MDLTFAMLADHVAETKEGKLVIVGEFDTIGASQFPATHPAFFLVARFQGNASAARSHRLMVRLIGPDGRSALPQDAELHVQANRVHDNVARANVVLHFAGLQFNQPGLYHFQLQLDGVHAAEVPLHLQQVVHQA
ncbi:MAG: hypothetical protein FIB01_06995 [Gemmatimonadetes bacterium]|nr:hypothetical protein [Gemmatimonadota bacterium]